MNLNFTKKGVIHKPINHWLLDDGNYLIIYQGSRGGNPELDFIVKYRSQKSRLRAPSHTHWIVDLLIKSESSPDRVCQFVKEWIDIYEVAVPFTTDDEHAPTAVNLTQVEPVGTVINVVSSIFKLTFSINV